VRATITDQPLDPVLLLDAVSRDAHGAVLLFIGTVRELNEGRRVSGIRYEAYREMAEAILDQIAEEAEQKVGNCAIAVTHRIGDLAVGEASVMIAVSTPHRAQAFEGNRYIIEEIKKRLPVWKHESYAEGDSAWVQGRGLPAEPPEEWKRGHSAVGNVGRLEAGQGPDSHRVE
jgi:molybdopterin synthase catalytic subunit